MPMKQALMYSLPMGIGLFVFLAGFFALVSTMPCLECLLGSAATAFAVYMVAVSFDWEPMMTPADRGGAR